MATRSAEDAVRDYLRYRSDPDSVRPDTTDIDAAIDAATDPVERVKLRSERARLQDVGATLEAEFIARVPEWAEAHGIDAEALLEEGVERRVLVEAGLLTGTSRRRSSGGGTKRTGSGSGKRVSRDEIERYLRGLRAGTTFTTATVANDAGGSTGTIRRVLDALLEDGTITEAGKDHSGPGRPRTMYERA